MSSLRNVGIVAHIDAGKTTLSERILFETGVIRHPGEVPDGTTFTDFLPQERERGISIAASAVSCRWKQWQFNLVDTPGHIDFTAEVERSLAVMDGIIVVLDAVKGVQAQTETVWRQAARHHLPCIVFVNKMDREGANPAEVVRQIAERFGIRPVPIQHPCRNGANQELLVSSAPQGEEAGNARQRLVEAIAEYDEEALEEFVSNREPSADALKRALRNGVLSRKLVPVLFGSSLRDEGVRELLDAIGNYLPSPQEMRGKDSSSEAPLSMRVFRISESTVGSGRLATVRLFGGVVALGLKVRNFRTGVETEVTGIYRVLADQYQELPEARSGDIVALAGQWGGGLRLGDTLGGLEGMPKGEKMVFPQPVCSVTLGAEEDSKAAQLAAVLKEFCREDPTLKLKAVGASLWKLAGMGELHIDVIRNRLKEEFGLATRAGNPRVEYRDTVTRPAETEGVFEKQFPDGRRIGCRLTLRVEPRERGSGLLLEGAAVLRPLSPECRTATMQGIRNVLYAEDSGFPLTDMKVTLVAISQPNCEMTETACFSAARVALENVLSQAIPARLEPVMKLQVAVPNESTGSVLADLKTRRGVILSVASTGESLAQISARVPLAELFGYASSLRSLSAGRGEVVAEPDQFAVLATH